MESNATEAEVLPGQQAIKALELYYTPSLILIGSAGNILSLIVIRSSVQLRRLSASAYLCGLAVSDTFYLAAILVPWLSFIQEELSPSEKSTPLHSGIVCPIMVYLSHVSSFLSAWLVLAFTAERFVAVRYPLKRASICTTRRARLIICILTLISLTSFTPLLFLARAQEFRSPEAQFFEVLSSDESTNVTWTTEPPQLPPATVVCNLDRRYEWVGTVFNSVDTVLAFLVPCLGIAALNVGIVASIREVGKRRVKRRSNKNLGGVPSFRCDANRTQQPVLRRKRPHAKITGMLLVVSTVFVALNLPSYVIRGIIFFEESRAMDENERSTSTRHLIVPQHAANLLFITNFGINFALYCVFGRNFRRALRSFCCRKLVCRCGMNGRGAAVCSVRATGSERVTSTLISESSRSCRRSCNGNSLWDNSGVEMESLAIH